MSQPNCQNTMMGMYCEYAKHHDPYYHRSNNPKAVWEWGDNGLYRVRPIDSTWDNSPWLFQQELTTEAFRQINRGFFVPPEPKPTTADNKTNSRQFENRPLVVVPHPRFRIVPTPGDKPFGILIDRADPVWANMQDPIIEMREKNPNVSFILVTSETMDVES